MSPPDQHMDLDIFRILLCHINKWHLKNIFCVKFPDPDVELEDSS